MIRRTISAIEERYGKKINNVVYLEMWIGLGNTAFFESWQIYMTSAPRDEIEAYHMERSRTLWISECQDVIVENTLYRIKTDENEDLVNHTITAYHEGRKNGTIRKFRLD